VQVSSPQLDPITYRNFNLCPHCIFQGKQSLLCRRCEGIPMISRSDGKTFHLLLADYPARYPAERASGKTEKISVCFWYSHVLDSGSTGSTVVILRDPGRNFAGLFRLIETAADLLAKQLADCYRPATWCELVNDGLRTMAYY
jgi:hypothetical protein